MGTYQDTIKEFEGLVSGSEGAWADISPEYAARMRLQNRFKTGVDIARYTADIMRCRRCTCRWVSLLRLPA